MKQTFLKSLLIWLPFAALITFTCLLSYLLVQQDIRQNANDPQIQLAEDSAQYLGAGITPAQLIPAGSQVDITTSLDPYLVIFNASGTEIGASGMLSGQNLALPSGVFADARQHREDRFTWQPEAGVRSAVVVDSFGGPNPGFVLAGRSLREVEIREDHMLWITICAWLAGLIGMFVVVWFAVSVILAKARIHASQII